MWQRPVSVAGEARAFSTRCNGDATAAIAAPCVGYAPPPRAQETGVRVRRVPPARGARRGHARARLRTTTRRVLLTWQPRGTCSVAAPSVRADCLRPRRRPRSAPSSTMPRACALLALAASACVGSRVEERDALYVGARAAASLHGCEAGEVFSGRSPIKHARAGFAPLALQVSVGCLLRSVGPRHGSAARLV